LYASVLAEIGKMIGNMRQTSARTLAIVGLVCTSLTFAGLAYAKEPSNEALIRLVAVDRFAFGGIGLAGWRLPGEADYQIIFSRPSALAEFETIYLVGNPQALAYALVGIRHLNLDRYRELAQPLRNSRQRVLTQRGCIVYSESLGAIIQHIDAGLY
jgi:hypothetical protein